MKWNLALATAIWLNCNGTGFAQMAVLRGTVTNQITGRPTACTVSITDSTGKVVIENESFRSGFRCPGTFTKTVPAGRTQIRITRGFETKAVEQEIDLPAGQETDLTFTLRRIVDLRKRGWYAGDSHVHMLHGERNVPVDFDFVTLTAQAEDLQYLSLAQAWNLDEPTPERLDAELRSRSRPDCWLTWNLEAPKNYYKGDAGRCLGHCWNMGLAGRARKGLDVIRVLLDASAWDYESNKPPYANFESHQLIHEQGGTVFYTHPARWWMGTWGGQGGYPRIERMRVSNMAVELPLDTLVGPTFDGLDVITGSGEFEANAKAFELWSLLINHGYHIAATGSSDACFDRPGGAVPGVPRLYTFTADGFSMTNVTRAAAKGRTFVTTGPLLIATVDKEAPGTAFPLDQKTHLLAVEAWASGADIRGLQRLEILRNCRPFQQFSTGGHPEYFHTNWTFRESETAWYGVRLFGSEQTKQVAITGAFYFDSPAHRPPPPVPARVHAKILDAQSGRKLEGTLTEVSFKGTIPQNGKRHSLPDGEKLISIPGTVRLRAEAKGYSPLTLSPIFDSPELVQTITGLSDMDLLNWSTFDRLTEQLGKIELVFRLNAKR
jgi:hypothetical protein